MRIVFCLVTIGCALLRGRLALRIGVLILSLLLNTFYTLNHADSLQRRGFVKRRTKVANHRLLNLFLDLRTRFTEQLLHRAVEKHFVRVVNANTGSCVGSNGYAIRRIHIINLYVDWNDCDIKELDTLNEWDDEGPASFLKTEAVFFCLQPRSPCRR